MIDLVALGVIMLLMRPAAVVLSVCIAGFVWGWPNSSRVLRRGTARFALMKSAPISVSAADDMTICIIAEMLRTAPLFGGFESLFERKWCSPAWLLDSGLDR